MFFHSTSIVIFLACCLFSSPQKKAVVEQQAVRVFHLRGYAQGTTYSIVYYAGDSLVTTGQVDSIMKVIDASMSLYKPSSLINRFNQSTKGGALDAHFLSVVKKSLEVYKASNGVFDITVAPLVEAWGFGPKKEAALPSSQTIRQIMAYVGSDKLSLRKNFLLKKNPKLQLDVNGIAQGYTVDVVGGFLSANGIKNFLVELGGEVLVQGRNMTTGEAFEIGLETPRERGDFDTEDFAQIVALPYGGLTTSGTYRKYKMKGDRKLSHLIDPRTGAPLQNEMISATVWAKDAITADAYDNVFMGMGIKQSFEFLKTHPGMDVYFIYQTPDGAVRDTASAGFTKLLKDRL